MLPLALFIACFQAVGPAWAEGEQDEREYAARETEAPELGEFRGGSALLVGLAFLLLILGLGNSGHGPELAPPVHVSDFEDRGIRR